MILKVLNDVIAYLEKGIEYNGKRQQIDILRDTRKLKTGSVNEQLIADWIEDGLGFRLTTMLLNSHRQQQGLTLVGQKSDNQPIVSKILKDRKKASDSR